MDASADGLRHHGDVLDTISATSRVLGNGALYLRMLRRFLADYPSGAHPLRDAFASADLVLAHRRAHSLKGTAGMIGAQVLHERAATLETQLRTGGLLAAVPALEQVELALEEVQAAVARVLDGEPAEGPDAAVNASTMTAPGRVGHHSAQATLQQLVTLLDLGDGAAIDVLEQMGPVCKSLLGANAYSEVMLAVHAFDFEAALLAIRKAVPAITMPP